MQTKRENRGGWRPNSGKKPETLSAYQVQQMLDTAERYAKTHGKTVDDILLDFVYAQVKVDARTQLAAIKLFKDKTCVPISEGGDADTNLAPTVYLPEERPDPAKVVQLVANN